jgi:hypothetical protein
MGNIIEPLTVEEFKTKSKQIPKGLFGHNTQVDFRPSPAPAQAPASARFSPPRSSRAGLGWAGLYHERSCTPNCFGHDAQISQTQTSHSQNPAAKVGILRGKRLLSNHFLI